MNPIPINGLNKHHLARIHSIVPNPSFGHLDETVGRRLADLGFSAGASLEVIAVGLFGKGPYAVRLNHQSQFSLRYAEAQKILCITEEENAA